jgi:hypothetical protein
VSATLLIKKGYSFKKIVLIYKEKEGSLKDSPFCCISSGKLKQK